MSESIPESVLWNIADLDASRPSFEKIVGNELDPEEWSDVKSIIRGIFNDHPVVTHQSMTHRHVLVTYASVSAEILLEEGGVAEFIRTRLEEINEEESLSNANHQLETDPIIPDDSQNHFEEVKTTQWIVDSINKEITKQVTLKSGELETTLQVQYTILRIPEISQGIRGAFANFFGKRTHAGDLLSESLATSHHLTVLYQPALGASNCRLTLKTTCMASGETLSADVFLEETGNDVSLFRMEDQDDVKLMASLFDKSEDMLFEFFGDEGLMLRCLITNRERFRDLLEKLL